MYHINKDIRSQRSKEWIYEALCNLIDKKPFKSITITELIEKAGVGRSTFYRNYDVKEDVLIERLDREFEIFYNYIFSSKELLKFQLSPMLFIPVFEYWQADSRIIESVIKAGRLSLLDEVFMKYINKIITKYDIFDLDKDELEYSAVIISGIVQSVLVKWVLDGKILSPEQLTKIISETAFREKTLQ